MRPKWFSTLNTIVQLCTPTEERQHHISTSNGQGQQIRAGIADQLFERADRFFLHLPRITIFTSKPANDPDKLVWICGIWLMTQREGEHSTFSACAGSGRFIHDSAAIVRLLNVYNVVHATRSGLHSDDFVFSTQRQTSLFAQHESELVGSARVGVGLTYAKESSSLDYKLRSTYSDHLRQHERPLLVGPPSLGSSSSGPTQYTSTYLNELKALWRNVLINMLFTTTGHEMVDLAAIVANAEDILIGSVVRTRSLAFGPRFDLLL
ncbi:uncharacterized protein EDB91DRAFT_1337936 [Suillus paluster]|uniref:uncharacterized protein n=1 Tax=Suillus paluster TaxID=48578 RepID=UPI001B85B510|nr:uncharacterized protein EDB91DRAFT_1337936 [Suillus paluster]KAG1734276.1 hypothetical protein EDB91DRAFT_1337936 [Suillus paluster]